MICKHCDKPIEEYPGGAIRVHPVKVRFKYFHLHNQSMYCDFLREEAGVHWAEPKAEDSTADDKIFTMTAEILNDTQKKHGILCWPGLVPLSDKLKEAYDLGSEHAMQKAIHTIIDMAERYDADIEGCDGDELTAYTEAIGCCFRLAYKVKYGKAPDKGESFDEFNELFRKIRKEAN